MTSLQRLVFDVCTREMRRRASLIEDAIIRLAEHGQRVELIEYHAPAYGIDTHVNLIVAGDVAETVRF